MDKDGAGVVEGEEGACEGRIREEIRRERVDVPVAQKPSEVVATADKEGALTWALWEEGREQETAGGLGDKSREGGKGMGQGDGLLREGTTEHGG